MSDYMPERMWWETGVGGVTGEGGWHRIDCEPFEWDQIELEPFEGGTEYVRADLVTAERDALRAEVERLREAGVGYSQQTVDALSRERDQLAARVGGLALLAADAVSALRYIEAEHGRLGGVGWDRVYDRYDALRAQEAPDA